MSSQLIQEITKTLDEPNTWLVRKVVNIIGAERARAFLQQTLDVETNGGMLVASGQRRRTPGGVFFHLVRKNISADERKAIFHRAKKKKATSQAQPPVEPPTWTECQAYMRKLLAHPRGEISTMKLTLSGRPNQVAKAKTCTVCIVAGQPAPPSLPRGLPTPPSTPVHLTRDLTRSGRRWRIV